MSSKTKIVLVQLGSPKSLAVKDVRSYLREFLGDPRVVDINPLLWKIILNLFVLPFRPAKSAQAYGRIWDGNSFPLITNTEKFAQQMAAELGDEYEVDHVFLLSEPRYRDLWDRWEAEGEKRAKKWIIVPMFPQYSESTTASVMDMFFHELKKRVVIPEFEFVTNFHKSRAFIQNSVRIIEDQIASEKPDELVISFHGIPKRRVVYKKDAYYTHCFETFNLIKENLKSELPVHMTFQSRFGSEEWLTPYTDEYVLNLVKDKKKKIAVYCPSFVADCLETTDEIGNELGEEVAETGSDLVAIPCLNDDKKWAKDFADYIQNNRTNELTYVEKEMPEQVMENPPLSTEAKSTLKIIFLTLFLDLVGFSIIFPLFPALAEYYLKVDSGNYFLQLILGGITDLTAVGGVGSSYTPIVLFGGALGALYSFLQFVAAPVWGTISDRIGRRPVLLLSVSCLALSYLLWFFSGSFTLLIIARLVGGIMGGNISTATAVVADITDSKNRSKGMAFIGIAFALGFIIGPAMGGILSMIDLTKIYPQLEAYGVNPFSMPAGLAFLLSAFNVYYLVRKFKETLPPEKRGQHDTERSSNPLLLFKPLPYKGVNLTNFGHFLFLAAFSGMEFTLTFLAVERLSYSSMDNAYMFIFIGVIIALIQGGVVRRRAAQVGEKKMAMMGLILLIPGLCLIGITKGSGLLYLGLLFLAAGSAMAIPCLTSLVSLYTPSQHQGRAIGIFRSLGALARVVGPVVASLVYWQYGSAAPYFLGAAFLLLPIILVGMLPSFEHEAKAS